MISIGVHPTDVHNGITCYRVVLTELVNSNKVDILLWFGIVTSEMYADGKHNFGRLVIINALANIILEQYPDNQTELENIIRKVTTTKTWCSIV